MTKIDPKLPVRTREGQPVQIITTKGRNPHERVIGYIGDDINIAGWRDDGKYLPSGAEHEYDLIQDREVWVNIYNEDFLAVFATKEAAQRSTKTPIARVRVPYTPGQFDD